MFGGYQTGFFGLGCLGVWRCFVDCCLCLQFLVCVCLTSCLAPSSAHYFSIIIKTFSTIQNLNKKYLGLNASLSNKGNIGTRSILIITQTDGSGTATMPSCFLKRPNKAICKRKNPKTTQNSNTFKLYVLG